MSRSLRIPAVIVLSFNCAFLVNAEDKPGSSQPGMQLGMSPSGSNSMSKGPPTQLLNKSLYLWTKDLESKDPGARELAVRTIPYFGPAAINEIPKLIKCMGDQDYNVRFAALQVLTTNPIEDPKHRADICKRIIGPEGLIYSPQVNMRAQVALSLIVIGTDARSAVDVLTSENYLKSAHSFELRKASAAALGSIAAADPKNPQAAGPEFKAIAALGNHLANEPSLAVRVEIAQSLARLGKPQKPEEWVREKNFLLERVNGVNGEKDPVLKTWLRACLIHLDESELKKQLAEIARGLFSDDPDMRVNAVKALGGFGAASKDHVGNLGKALDSVIKSTKTEDVEFLRYCVWAAGSIGPDAFGMSKVLEGLSKNHPDETVRKWAAEALVKVNRPAPPKK